MLDRWAYAMQGWGEFELILTAFGMLLAGFLLGLLIRRGGQAEMHRAPYVALVGLLTAGVGALPYLFLFTLKAQAMGLFGVLFLGVFALLALAGLIFGVLAHARSVNAYGNGRGAWMGVVPFANLVLMGVAPKVESQMNPVLSTLLVVIGISGLVGGRVLDRLVSDTLEDAPAESTETIADAITSQIGVQGIESVLAEIAMQTGRTQVDSETVLVRADAAGSTLHFVYEVSSLAAQAGPLLEPAVRQNTCDNPVSLALMDGGATLVMDYNGPDGVQVISVTMVKRDCGA
jgi:hypothetical protein